jgi:2-succinyl-6-hydroxy-2,4-cyclohexadiene-1-carboxylate synthase
VPESVVLLHGFSGTHRAWDGVRAHLDGERYLPLALDLPGHGAAAEEGRAVTFAACVEHVLASAPERFVLCGYSMGGRIALHVALAAPRRVSRLVLIASSAGIEDERERALRRDSDEALARRLEAGPLEHFIERWLAQPLFAGDPPEVRRLARADQRHNNACCLAAVLRGVGAGQMTPLWGRLSELGMPTAIVAGERDERYVQLGRRIAGLMPDARLRVLRGGHRLPLENPAGVAAVLEGV